MKKPFKLKYNNSAFPFKSPLKDVQKKKDKDGNYRIHQHTHVDNKGEFSHQSVGASGYLEDYVGGKKYKNKGSSGTTSRSDVSPE